MIVDTVEGQVPFKVALIADAVPIVTSEIGARYFNSHPMFVLVNTRGASQAANGALEDRLTDIAQRHALVLVTDARQAIGDVIGGMFDVILALFAGLTSLTGIVAALGIANTLIASVLERQREIGTLTSSTTIQPALPPN